ncbi:hypothetical protein EZ449_02695 [Pedobacter frigidisoli]|uniref:PemK-like, MazF-like toxin of type II toxin-antitoxin system n=1 Tax=Pedobacter frigidisoli TaxID=2530455 RepID=A0A4R0P9S6_9SPHI|nr:hypothetical protein [Pedobacter frigidisoli]TCD12972.1 hypothetical protein EZ449_02695 [Pedobacter frigidisoli]
MNDPNKEAQKGNILWSDNNLNKSGRRAHYMVFIKPHDAHYFVGAMITHAKGFNNIELEENHFEKSDANGKNYKVYFDRSLIVGNPLFKSLEWRPFEKVGQLTEEGIAFVENEILKFAPAFYVDNAN